MDNSASRRRKDAFGFVTVRGNSFNKKFSNYLKSDDLVEFRERLNKRMYTVGDTGISSRIFSHWGHLGVLPEGLRSDGGWRRANLVELTWLLVVQRLRLFGLSLRNIAGIRLQVMDWRENLKQYPMFEFYVANAISGQMETYLRVSADGAADCGTSEDIEEGMELFGSRDMLLISMKSILADAQLSKIKTAKKLIFLKDDGERELLDSVRTRDIDEVSVKIRNGRIGDIETTSTTTDRIEGRKIKGRIFLDKSYGRVTEDYQLGDRTSTKVTIRKKYDK